MTTIKELKSNLKKQVTIQGWMYNKRSSGKIAFLQLRDGSGFVQAIAEREKVGKEMWKLVDELEKKGGALKAIGWMREELVKESRKRQEELETKDRYLVGVNEFIVSKEREVKIDMEKYRPTEEQIKVAEERAKQVKKFKAERDKKKTKNSLENLRGEAEKGENHNLIPAIKKALRADATLGEIIGVIRMANGYDYDPYRMIQYPF